MPAMITHHLFGESILEMLGPTVYPTSDERDAFLLGNQGPDPLFYSLTSTEGSKVRHLGQLMHRMGCERSLSAMRDFSNRIAEKDRGIAQAYVAGLLCHYALDRTTHPYIFWHQYRLMDSGVEGLADAGSQIHSQIEADLDSMMLWKVKNLDITRYRPYVLILQGSDRVLDAIDKLYRYAAASAYGIVLRQGEYRRAVHDFRFTMHALYSRTGAKRRALGRIERIFRKHSQVQAMSHRSDVFENCDWDNRNHETWTDPFTGATSTESFIDLFARAQGIALDDISLLVSGGSLHDIFQGLNYCGNPYEGKTEAELRV